jgi:hypothetical protein
MKFIKDIFLLSVGCAVYLIASLLVSAYEVVKNFRYGNYFKQYLKMTPEDVRKENVALAIKIAKRQKMKGL